MPGRNQRTGSKRLVTIIAQLAEAEAITEELKAVNPMARVGAMDSIRSRAEEIVLQDLIWEDDAI